MCVCVQEAEAAERGATPMVATCAAIVSTVVGVGVEDADRSRTWKADAADCLKRGSVETARAIYAHALGVFPGKKSIWRSAAQLEKDHGSSAALDALLAKAVTYCPQVLARETKHIEHVMHVGQMKPILPSSPCMFRGQVTRGPGLGLLSMPGMAACCREV